MEMEIFGLDGVRYYSPPKLPYFYKYSGKVHYHAKMNPWDGDDNYVFLPEVFQRRFFSTVIEILSTHNLPLILSDGGIGSDFPTSKKDFEFEVRKLMLDRHEMPVDPEIIHKYLLFNDIRSLTDSIFSRLADVRGMFNDFYVELYRIDMLVEFSPYSDYEDSVYRHSGSATIRLFSLLENLIIKLYSILDLITKIFFEYFADYKDFGKYPRMKSSNKLFKHYNEFKDKIETQDTIFESNDTIKLLETMRHEIIHNGALDYQNILWVRIEKMQIVEKYILLPDIADGKFESFNNRKRFYSQENKLNYMLPGLISHFNFLVYNTMQIILKEID